MIQHLNYVVDPKATALTDYDPPGGVTGGANPQGGGPTGDGTYPDPTGAPRNDTGRLVRFGGTGSRFSLKRNKGIYLKQAKMFGIPFPHVFAPDYAHSFFDDVSAGNCLLCLVTQYSPFTAGRTGTVSVSDSLGNFWTQGFDVTDGAYLTQTLFYVPTLVSGACSVTAHVTGVWDGVHPPPIPQDMKMTLMEYAGTDVLLPVDATNSTSGSGGAVAQYSTTTGSVPVNHAKETVVGFSLATGLSPTFAPATTDTLRVNDDGNETSLLWVTDRSGRGSATALTGVVTQHPGPSPAYSWLAAGVSLRPK